MPIAARKLLSNLESLKYHFGKEASLKKRDLMRRLESASLPSAECCSAPARVALLLARLSRRLPPAATDRIHARQNSMPARTCGRFRKDLIDLGIEGTEIRYEFYVRMAQWLARRWPDRLEIDWAEFDNTETLEKILPLLALYNETPGLDEFGYEVREWIERLKGPGETDAAFVVNRIKDLELDPFMREYFFEHLKLPLILLRAPMVPAAPERKFAARKSISRPSP